MNAPYCDVDLTPQWDYDIEKAKLLRCPAGVVTDKAVGTSGIDVGIVIGIIVALLLCSC